MRLKPANALTRTHTLTEYWGAYPAPILETRPQLPILRGAIATILMCGIPQSVSLPASAQPTLSSSKIQPASAAAPSKAKTVQGW